MMMVNRGGALSSAERKRPEKGRWLLKERETFAIGVHVWRRFFLQVEDTGAAALGMAAKWRPRQLYERHREDGGFWVHGIIAVEVHLWRKLFICGFVYRWGDWLHERRFY